MSELSYQYILRMEGVNLFNVLDDTNEISVRRGSGLMLRQAVLDVKEKTPVLNAISLGASVGLFQFNSDDPEQTVVDVSRLLNDNFPQLTFVVDAVELNGSFKNALEAVIAKNRFRQFQQVTLVPPIAEKQADTCCEMNQIHPRSSAIRKGDKVSVSVKERFDYGRDKRQNFYDEELETEHWRHQFTDDLSELTKTTDQQDFGNLTDKMAVIYLDGNGFGNIQRECDSAEQLGRFDETNRNYRRSFLKALLINAVNDSDFMDETKRIRLETLLWGGDEIILIVPAWKGMEVIQTFYKISDAWVFENDPLTHNNKKPLTHAGGIVFCNHKTPVSQAVKAAQELAEYVKEKVSRFENRFEYLVLESIDYPTQSIVSFWDLRYGNGVKKHCAALKPVDGDWRDLSRFLSDWLNSLPKGAILNIAMEWVDYWRNGGKDASVLEQRVERLKDIDKNAYDLLFSKVFPLFTASILNDTPKEQQYNSGWVHLTELWDYLAPLNRRRGQ